MNILFLAKRFYPHQGGVERHLWEVTQLLKADHKITVVTEQHDTKLPFHQDINDVEVFRVPANSSSHNEEETTSRELSKLSIWKWFFHHISLIKNADVIHVHDVFFWVLPLRFFFFWKKFYITFHGYEAPGAPTKKQIFWHRVAAALTEGNICIGGFHQKWYGVTPAFTSYGGVSLEQKNSFGQEIKKKILKFVEEVLPFVKAKSKVRAVFVGRLDHDTGIEKYVEALHLIKVSRSNKEITLDVVGDGPLRKKLEEYVREHHLEVTFLGQKEDVIKYYKDATLACVSGYLTILEALQMRLPVIATYHNEIKKDYLEMTPFANWITITATSEEIAESILSGTYAQPSPEAVHWVTQQTWSSVTQLYLRLWKK